MLKTIFITILTIDFSRRNVIYCRINIVRFTSQPGKEAAKIQYKVDCYGYYVD